VLARLYAILDVDLARARGHEPLALLNTWLDEGLRLVQLRAKHASSGPLLELADAMSTAAHEAGATFIVNDRADLARLSGAHGVHVGQGDLRPSDARTVIGPSAIVGLSTHNDAQVRAGLGEPVTYLAIGPVFPTGSKEQPDPVIGLDGVRRAVDLARASMQPIVAIGGITLDRAAEVIEAGAESVAVISDLLTGDPAARCREYLKVLE
jgi:thiamine-phosphate pyrophosphorylase